MITSPYHAEWSQPVFLKEYFYQKILLNCACNPIEGIRMRVFDIIRNAPKGGSVSMEWSPDLRENIMPLLGDPAVRRLKYSNVNTYDCHHVDGKGGMTTEETTIAIHNYAGMPAVAHRDCLQPLDAVKEETDSLLKNGVNELFVVRGEGKKIEGTSLRAPYKPLPGGFWHANYQIDALNQLYNNGAETLGIGSALHLDKHPESPTMAYELEKAREKKTPYKITQVILNNDILLPYVDDPQSAGAEIIVPLLMAPTSYRLLERLVNEFGVSAPQEVKDRITENRHDAKACRLAGMDVCERQFYDIIGRGLAKHVHFASISNQLTLEMLGRII